MEVQNPRPVLVVGSANMDMVVSVPRFPRPGETLFGNDFGLFPGGKGANQAVACGKLGGQVRFIGKFGEDVFQQHLRRSMGNAGVDLNYTLTDPEAPTGTALIMVEQGGQNEIVVVSGSNGTLTGADVRQQQAAFLKVGVVLMQLEIPLVAVEAAVWMAQEQGARTILNPAPAQSLPDDLLRQIDYLTPNESEAELLTGLPVADLDSAEKAARKLLQRGVRNVIVTLGARGALLVNNERTYHQPAPSVEAVDTTAAGDAFNGALALAIAGRKSVEEAMAFACRVAACSVTRRGAQDAMPTAEEFAAFAAQAEGVAAGDGAAS